MRKLSIRERVLLVCLGVVAAISGYILLFHLPMEQRVQSLQTQIDQGEQLQQQLEAKLTEQQQMQRTLQQLEAEGTTPMPLYDNLQAVMVELHNILSGCREYALSFQGEQTEENVFCRTVTAPFVCEDYTAARAVLQDLYDSELRSALQDIQFSQEDDGSVKVTVSVAFYEYCQEQPET